MRAAGRGRSVAVITYHEPRTNRADTRVRPYDGMVHHGPRATSHMPLFTDSLDEAGQAGQPGQDPGSMPEEESHDSVVANA